MIKIVTGDLLEAKERFIVHQVNCRGKMGSGVALQIRNKWPQVYESYISVWRNVYADRLLGEVQFVPVADETTVCNLFGQLTFGYDGKRYTNYEALYKGLEKIKVVSKGQSIAIPYKMGSDRGGASWTIVMSMIEEIFADQNITIYKLEEK